MSDLQKYIENRKKSDSEFAKSYDSRYEEFKIGVREWGWDLAMIRKLVFNALNASLLPEPDRLALRTTFQALGSERLSSAAQGSF